MDLKTELKGKLNHIAFIMDGNGRWAKERNQPRTKGHKRALEILLDLVEECSNLGIKYVSLFAFSTENWNRPKSEIKFLFQYLVLFFKLNIKRFIKDEIRIVISGDYSKLPKSAVNATDKAIKDTANCKGTVLNICLNYGGIDELVMAFKKIGKSIESSKIKAKDISKELIEKNFYVPELPNIDLMIRTSGEFRISNFMLYKLSYAELMFPKTYFPDFSKKDLYECLNNYLKRDRRFGAIK